MRRINSLATFLIVLAVAGGLPEGHVSASGAASCSCQAGINLQALRESRPPAEAAASRDGARINIAAASRSIQLHDGIASDGVALPDLRLAGTLTRTSGALTRSVPLSPSLVRGPPLHI